MKQTTLAFLLSIMFAALTLAPDIIMLVDNDYDVSMLIDSSEEEERKGEEKVKDLETEIPEYVVLDSFYKNTKKAGTLNFHLNNYNSIYTELTSPPPELNIL